MTNYIHLEWFAGLPAWSGMSELVLEGFCTFQNPTSLPTWNLGLVTPGSHSSQSMVTYSRCSQLHCQHCPIGEANLLCPVRALKSYLERSTPFRHSEQLFICFGGHTKGLTITETLQMDSRCHLFGIQLGRPGLSYRH